VPNLGLRPFLGAWRARRANGIVCLMLLSLSACIAPKSYVDPALPEVSFASLRPNGDPKPVELFFELQANGGLNAAGTSQVRSRVVSILLRSKQFSAVHVPPETSDRRLFITINNFGDLDKAGAVATGLTLGALGSAVTDRYAMDVMLQVPGKEAIRKTYAHAIYTTIGNAPGPPGLQPHPADEAFGIALEQLLLNSLQDLSRDGAL
jgi:hypothetical protein